MSNSDESPLWNAPERPAIVTGSKAISAFGSVEASGAVEGLVSTCLFHQTFSTWLAILFFSSRCSPPPLNFPLVCGRYGVRGGDNHLLRVKTLRIDGSPAARRDEPVVFSNLLNIYAIAGRCNFL